MKTCWKFSALFSWLCSRMPKKCVFLCDKQEFNKIINHKSILGDCQQCCVYALSWVRNVRHEKCLLALQSFNSFLVFFPLSLCFVCVAALMAILDICDWTPCRSSTCRWSLAACIARESRRNMNKKTNHVQWFSQYLKTFLMGTLHHLDRAIWV